MAISQTEIDDAAELFSPIGRIRTRKMMGGLMIYADDLPFALYDPDNGYFVKVDNESRADFEAEGIEPFIFAMKDGKTAKMNYYALPDACYDDPQELKIWGDKGLAAALRAKAKKRPKKKSMKKKIAP